MAKESKPKTETKVSAKPKMIKVAVVRRDAKAAVIEQKTDQGPLRLTVPHTAVKDDRVSADDLSAAVKHTEDWAALLRSEFDVDSVFSAIEKDLRVNGIHTLEDFHGKPQAVVNAVMRCIKTTLPDLRKAVEQAK